MGFISDYLPRRLSLTDLNYLVIKCHSIKLFSKLDLIYYQFLPVLIIDNLYWK